MGSRGWGWMGLLLALSVGLRAQAPPTPAPQAMASPFFAGYGRDFHLSVPRIEPVDGFTAHVRDGQLHLRLNDFLALVLRNNTQVHLLQLNNPSAQYSLLATNSPFDPTLTTNFSSTRSITPEYSQINGAPTLSSLGQNTGVTYSQLLGSGQTVQATFGGNRNSNNSEFNTFNPSVGADLNISITQPLWRNRGNLQNRTSQLVARTQILVVTDQTQTSVADQLVSAANQYWQTVEARDQIDVAQQALDLAKKSNEHDQQALALGALAPGNIYTSQAQVAQDQVQLLQAQSNYKQQLDMLRRLMGADLDAAMKSLPISLDDDPAATLPQPPPMSVDDAVALALRQRPEMDAAQRQLKEDNFTLAQARDALKPQLNLTGSYGGNGLGGDAVPVTNSLGVSSGGTTGGFGNALGQVFNFGFPTYGFTLSLNLPVRNSSGEANLANSLLSQTNHQYQQRNEQQQVIQDVRAADTQLGMAVAVVQSATTARDLSRKNVDAEQQKYELGSITVFELLQAQVQLSGAQTTLLNAYTSYQQALIAYERATWTLLDKLNLQMAKR